MDIPYFIHMVLITKCILTVLDKVCHRFWNRVMLSKNINVNCIIITYCVMSENGHKSYLCWAKVEFKRDNVDSLYDGKRSIIMCIMLCIDCFNGEF